MEKQPASESTLFVNLFAGPGCGKSTTAAGIFHELKKQGFRAEYIQEYAKDATWRGDYFTLGCQPYITGKQLFRQYRVNGKIQVAVTDSPLLIGLAYGGFGVTDTYKQWVAEAHNMFNNLNIFLVRDSSAHPYQQYGRSQDEAQATQLDREIEGLLFQYGVLYKAVLVGDDSVNQIVQLIKEKLTQNDAKRISG